MSLLLQGVRVRNETLFKVMNATLTIIHSFVDIMTVSVIIRCPLRCPLRHQRVIGIHLYDTLILAAALSASIVPRDVLKCLVVVCGKDASFKPDTST
jgi:hypothetical protein